MGGEFSESRDDERPIHQVTVGPFWIDETEVTNAKFREFVEATGYKTTAEVAPKMQDIMKQLPAGTPKPSKDMLVPGSLVFRQTDQPVRTDDFRQWWHWTAGANWQHPTGPDSDIEGLDDHPVVHVSWFDAVEFCNWAGKRLPTEAEWEFAARGGLEQQPYVWGSEKVSDKMPQANIWQGQFPFRNTLNDGYLTTAPAKQFPGNGFGLYDVAGNVWEWTADWYRADTYRNRADEQVVDPIGPEQSYYVPNPREPRRVQRGGSFLCHRDYCSSYRPSARMSCSPDTGSSHTGFRCVTTEELWARHTNKPGKDSKP